MKTSFLHQLLMFTVLPLVLQAHRRSPDSMQNGTDANCPRSQHLAARAVGGEENAVNMIHMMEAFKIVDLSAVPVTSGLRVGPSQLTTRLQTLQAEQEISVLGTQMDALWGLAGEPLIEEAVALDLADPTIQKIFAQFQTLQVELDAARNSGLGGTHPDVVRLESSVAEIRRLLDQGARAVKNSLAQLGPFRT